jgi:hypothetical protein
MRSFLGLVNSIRRVINVETVREMNTLAPLTSAKKDVPYKPEPVHYETFEKLKLMLIYEIFTLPRNHEKPSKCLKIMRFSHCPEIMKNRQKV